MGSHPGEGTASCGTSRRQGQRDRRIGSVTAISWRHRSVRRSRTAAGDEPC